MSTTWRNSTSSQALQPPDVLPALFNIACLTRALSGRGSALLAGGTAGEEGAPSARKSAREACDIEQSRKHVWWLQGLRRRRVSPRRRHGGRRRVPVGPANGHKPKIWCAASADLAITASLNVAGGGVWGRGSPISWADVAEATRIAHQCNRSQLVWGARSLPVVSHGEVVLQSARFSSNGQGRGA